ncbi:J domain-containing protein [Luteibacter aegosomaticola]|uniref:J domain-containing protein n=1 Tax=Luteibacter aegosomaticola TaxID=2911538 RepID=UPI001FFB9E6E|nr:J domain-containing protein [Luteibacter aegosomaticola]UPG92088.1 J domain-containing protein [Luteibacter aegosomaticola]
MADETDFLDLYGKLRLQPDCSLADFKQAYRRHVSQWHPDRRSRGERADALAARRLQRLMAQYSAAMDFHRRHGRLPGAAPATTTPPCRSALARDPDTVRDSAAVNDPAPAAVPDDIAAPIARKRAPTRFAWVGVLVVAGVLVWDFVPDPDRVDPVAEGVPAVTAEAAPVVSTASLTIGMKDDEVTALEGEPTLRSADRWEYGPSWVRFEGGSVVDWYSSPLRTLHVRSAHAPR